MTVSFLQTVNRVLPIGLVAVGVLLAVVWVTRSGAPPCNPQEAEATLADSADLGILGVNRPPSLSNLLWVHVGPRWHRLSLTDKQSLDAIVRCAARTVDEQGQHVWQAVYYDQQTGDMVALTSRQYGFRLQHAD